MDLATIDEVNGALDLHSLDSLTDFYPVVRSSQQTLHCQGHGCGQEYSNGGGR
jgi:hypothetical protein